MKTAQILGIALVLQLLLAAGITWQQVAAGGSQAPQPLLDFATNQVDRIELDDASNKVVLVKDADGWTLPDLQELAANTQRVDKLLSDLDGLKTGWPVADTASSIERLEVDDDKYQRKLVLKDGDNDVLGEYYFGTSPGLRQTHGRRAGEDAVFALAINNFDMPADPNDWLDKTRLALTGVEKITGPDYTLVKNGDDWRFDHLDNASDMLDESKVSDMLGALKSLRVLRVADKLPDTDPVMLTFGDMEKSWTYAFYQDGDTYTLHRNDIDAAFTISKSTYDRIAGVTRDGLLIPPPKADEGENPDEAPV